MGLLRRATGRKIPPVEARIAEALEQMRPLLPIEHGGVRLVEFRHDSGVAVLRVDGGCSGCELSAGSLLLGIEAHLRMRVPELRRVREVGNSYAPGEGLTDG